MTQQTLFDLIAAFEKGSAARLEYTEGESRLVLERSIPAAPFPPAQPAAVCAPAVPATPAATAAVTPPTAGSAIRAPLVGTFYAAAEPGAAPFVRPGDTVQKGQTVCILEAMKMINEIPAPCNCVIEECLLKDGELAGFDDPLFTIREL